MRPSSRSDLARGTLAPRLAALALAVVSLIGPCTAEGQPAPPPTVLVLYWSTEDFPGTSVLHAAIKESLEARGTPVDLSAEYVETDRFAEDVAAPALREYIRLKYRDRRIRLVITIAEPALAFALTVRPELFPGAPIVYSGVIERSGSRSDDGGLAGVVSGAAYADTAALALAVHPGMSEMVVIAYAPNSSLEQNTRSALEPVARRVKMSYITETSVPALLDAVRAVPATSVILYVRHSRDDPGSVVTPADVASLVARAAPVPVYGIVEPYIGMGVVGGVVTEAHNVGTRVAAIARQILDGTPPEDIPIEPLNRQPVFDARQLRRWGIPERSLPAGSSIRFRTTSVWEEYRTLILATLSVVVLQALLIGGLVFERRRRRRAEHESRRSLAAMAHLDRRVAMGELATSLAHELNQPLNAILQNAGAATLLLSGEHGPESREELQGIISDISSDDMRASEIIRRMRGMLQKHELESRLVALNDVAEETIALVRHDAESKGIQLEADLAGDVWPVLGDRIHLQQVVLNLLMNAVDAVAAMPAERRRIRVWTQSGNGDVRLGVADQGTGIPADGLSQIFEPFYTTKAGAHGMGMGLAIARNIIDAHGGRMAAENNAGDGANVWFSVPLNRGPSV